MPVLTERAASPAEIRHLSRVTGAAGLVVLVLVLGTSLIGNFQSAPFTASGPDSVRFFETLDDTMGRAGSFLTTVGLLAMVWFAVGVALLTRTLEPGLPWRSAIGAASACVAVASGLVPSWDAAIYRASSLDAETSRYAFDLGNLTFANQWVAFGSFAVVIGWLIVSTGFLPAWLGWLGIVSGVGSVLSRTIWTNSAAFLPFAVFWLWVGILAVMLLLGRHLRNRS